MVIGVCDLYTDLHGGADALDRERPGDIIYGPGKGTKGDFPGAVDHGNGICIGLGPVLDDGGKLRVRFRQDH